MKTGVVGIENGSGRGNCGAPSWRMSSRISWDIEVMDGKIDCGLEECQTRMSVALRLASNWQADKS